MMFFSKVALQLGNVLFIAIDDDWNIFVTSSISSQSHKHEVQHRILFLSKHEGSEKFVLTLETGWWSSTHEDHCNYKYKGGYFCLDAWGPVRNVLGLASLAMRFDLIWWVLEGRRILLFEDFHLNEAFWWQNGSKTASIHPYTVHEIMTDAVKVLQKLPSFRFRHPIPYFFKDKLMAIGDDPTHKRDVEQADIIFYAIDISYSDRMLGQLVLLYWK